MVSRILLGLLAIFWVVMTVLIWRSEYLGTNLTAIPVDPDAVWERILTSPDSSSLAIVHQGRRLGFCHLITSVADSLDRGLSTNAPEGMVRRISRYQLDFSGNIQLPGADTSLRFDGTATLSQHHEWEEFQLQLISRPWLLTVEATREEDVLHLAAQGPEFAIQRTLRLSELNNPVSVVTELLTPMAPVALGSLPFPVPNERWLAEPSKLEWLATTDRLLIGGSPTQVYRLELELAEGVDLVILVSRAGEILRVDLPRNHRMVNEALSGF